ncbi:uncharacterized protein LOC128860633 [Anastrepha ludens]|uniref:uncharacterized protein LOC128860633 n=1 Tax=Anastrepha ludens TaxID=28586 RepID=UPI0023B0830F|nr:uncharacterized protein LOC128860633 [Anastrepha ludens]
MDDFKLIREVHKRPFFYTKCQAGYRNSKLRNKGWTEIGAILKSSGDECCSRWRVIRDRYVKLIAKKTANKKLTDIESNWELYPHLGFLRAHIQSRTHKTKLKKSESNEETEDSLMSMPDMDCENTLPIEIATVESLHQTRARIPEASTQLSEIQESLSTFMKNVEELLKQRHTTPAEANKNEAFYRMVGAKLAELPEEEQEETKLYIISHVFERVKVYKQQMKCTQKIGKT